MMNRWAMMGRAKAAVGEIRDKMDEEAKKFQKKIFAHRIQQEEVEAFQPPVFVKSEDEKQFLVTALSKNFLFDSLDNESLSVLVDSFENIQAKKNQCIIEQGTEGDYFYVLKTGKVSFHVDGKVVGTAERGTGFGELSLLYSAPRAASVYADTDCELFRLDQRTFRNTLQTQTQNADRKILDIVKTIPMLKGLEYSDLIKFVRAMTPQPFQKDEYIVRKGDVGKTFYIIQEGQVSGTDITIGGSKYEDQVFGPGDCFGWRSIVHNEPLVGTAQALTDGTVMLIDSETFLSLFGGVKGLLMKYGDKITLNSLAVIRDSYLDPSIVEALADMMEDVSFPAGHIIAEQGEEIEAALYKVREGQVRIESSLDQSQNRIITNGGYFGEDQLLADHELLGVGKPIVRANYTVTAMEGSCQLGVLKLEDCRKILNTTMLGLGKDPMTSPVDASIRYDDLTRHVMLGAGSFGQVWLVSRDKGDGPRQAFALKVQSKCQLIDSHQAEGVVSERNIMARLNDPFIIKLVNSYQDQQRVFMLTGLLQGGELSSLVYSEEYIGLGEEQSKFYAACVLEGLTFMHRRKIVHRDLKPQNVMINEKGYGVIIDLGFAKYVPGKTYTFCGTILYIAPEVVCYTGHDMGADHWSLACMIYEMCTGESAFYESGMDETALLKRIVRGKFRVSGYMSVDLKTLLVRMLVPNPAQRLGSLAGGLQDIYDSPWFASVDFEKLRKQELEAPWVPDLKDPLDASNFYDCSDVEDKFEMEEPELTAEQQEVFKTFGDTTDSA